jgi:hypothetical protein
VAAFEDLDAPGALELLGKAPDPARAARLTRAQVPAVLKHAGRRKDHGLQAFAALRVSPGARAFCDQQRAKGREHKDALRTLASRLAGILHGCLKTRTCYDLKPPLDIQTPGMAWLTIVGFGLARRVDLQLRGLS